MVAIIGMGLWGFVRQLSGSPGKAPSADPSLPADPGHSPRGAAVAFLIFVLRLRMRGAHRVEAISQRGPGVREAEEPGKRGDHLALMA